MEFRSFSVLSIFVAAVLAQSSSNPYIPSGISSSCTTYLTNLNSNTDILTCTRAFTTALTAFTPGTSTTSPTSSDISSALNTLCAAGALNQCPQSTITSQLASFYSACSNELTSSPNQMVKVLYDVLYVLFPLRSAVCSKDDNGKYCATELYNSSSTGTVALAGSSESQQQSLLSQYLYTPVASSGAFTRRDLSNTTVALIPNTTTFGTTNLVFLFLQPTMPSSKLCTTCTKNIMTPYITFESNAPYGSGISNSPLLAGQVPLYNNITNECGANFLSGAVQAAGGLSSGLGSGAPLRADVPELSAAVSAILGVAAFVAASL